MRTTVEFDEDTAAAIAKLRNEKGMGLSEAVNELVRRGLLPRGETPRYVQRTRRLGLRIDVSNIADALEAIEGPQAR